MDGVIQMNEIKIKLQFLIPSLPRAEKIVAEYMLSHAEQISDMTIAMLSEESKASEATISRFCKRLGYSSFVQLKQDFAKSEIEAEDEHNPKPVSANDSLVDIFDKVVQGILRSLNNTRTFLQRITIGLWKPLLAHGQSTFLPREIPRQTVCWQALNLIAWEFPLMCIRM